MNYCYTRMTGSCDLRLPTADWPDNVDQSRGGLALR
jgi:hypothetical protein